jgi:hypothetical protein
MKEIKQGVATYRNCTIKFTISENAGSFLAHAHIHEPATDTIESVWSDENNPYPSQGTAEVEIVNMAKKVIDDIYENK